MSEWRNDFPGLTHAYLDSAATAHKPKIVIDKMAALMGVKYATVSRGLYKTSQEMTAAYEAARGTIATFLNASDNEIVFTKNATESLNLVAQSWGRSNLRKGDRVLLTEMEHHANIVPWQILQKEKEIVIDVLPITKDGDLDLSQIDKLITRSTKLFSFTTVSNVLGTVNPVKDIIAKARALNPGIVICIDASQAAPHGSIDVRDWDCDFLTFTGHKVYGPTGVGILYGKADLLNAMPPFLGGGDMIETVSFDGTTFRDAPHKFEAGTPAFIEAIGLAAAIDYLNDIGWDKIQAHEAKMAALLFKTLNALDGVTVIGNPVKRFGIASFVLDDCHPNDAAMIMDQMGVSVRVGHHCAMPLLQRLGHKALIRASCALYTNEADIECLAQSIQKTKRMLAA